MIITGIGNTGGIGITTLIANFALYLINSGKDNIYWLSLSELIPPLFYNEEAKWLEFEKVYRQVPFWNKLNCSYCDACVKACKTGAIAQYGDLYVIYSELCISCDACIYACKSNSIEYDSKIIGVIERNSFNDRIFRVKLNKREIFSSWHCNTIIKIMKRKLPEKATIFVDFPSGFRELWAEFFNISDKIIFYTNDIDLWGMFYKSFSHDQAEVVLVVDKDHFDEFYEKGFSFALAVPRSKEINQEAISGKMISDEEYLSILNDMKYMLNIE